MSRAILTCDQVRECEQRAVAAGVSMSQLMQRAGEACAKVVAETYPAGRVVVLAGPGNNGGDAFAAARVLAEAGRDVVVYELAAGKRTEEGAEASKAWNGARRSLPELKVERADILLDGLFGAGLSRPMSGEAEPAAIRVNASGARVVAIDVPSGVMGDTGKVGGAAIRAQHTVTFGAKKPAHVLYPAAEECGEVHVAEIGFGAHVDSVGGGRLHENGPELWADKLPWPGNETHKHKRGRLDVVTGTIASTGAARLAAGAGLRIGAGLVTLLCPPGALAVVAGAVTAPLTASFRDAGELAKLAEPAGAVVIGPAAGVNVATRANVEALAAVGPALVLDADALTVFSGEVDALARVLAGDATGQAVLTPHPGEFERLFPGLVDASASKIEAAREAARLTGAFVVLKGPDTIIADPGGAAVVNTHATPFLATAGSGDVLAGMIGGLLAQGLDAFVAASAAVWMHGDAALRAGPGMVAEDLDQALRGTIAALYAAR